MDQPSQALTKSLFTRKDQVRLATFLNGHAHFIDSNYRGLDFTQRNPSAGIVNNVSEETVKHIISECEVLGVKKEAVCWILH